MLIIVFGLPGSGKTYFASALAKDLKCLHLNTDVLRKEGMLEIDYSEEGRAKVYQKLLETAKEYLKQKLTIIIDGTFLKKSQRILFDELATKLKKKIAYIEIKASEEVIKERVSKKRSYSDADFEIYKKLEKEYEPMVQEHLVLFSDLLKTEEMLFKAKKFLDLL